MQTIKEYINENFGGSRTRFAIANKVARQQVTVWIAKDFIVINDELYSKRRKLKK